MKAHIASTRLFSGSAVLAPSARLLLHKWSAVKPLHAPRPRVSFKHHAALQSSDLASRVPGSTVQQQVRLGKVLQNAAVYLFLCSDAVLSLLLLGTTFACISTSFLYLNTSLSLCLTTAVWCAQASSLEVQHDKVPSAVQRILDEFQSVSDPKERYKLLLRYAKKLPALDAYHKIATNRVMGCTSEVFMTASLDKQNRVQFAGDSDSELTRGLCAVLVQGMSGLTPAEVLQVSFICVFIHSLSC